MKIISKSNPSYKFMPSTFSIILLLYTNGWMVYSSTQGFQDIIECSDCCINNVEVKYPNGKFVESGNKLTPSQVKEEPKVSWSGDSNLLYTLIMIDPDAPSAKNPTKRDWRHWLVVNIQGAEDIHKGKTLSSYKGAGPPKDTGFHRYIFLVYVQPGAIATDSLNLEKLEKERASFDTQNFVISHDLGSPKWCNSFISRYED